MRPNCQIVLRAGSERVTVETTIRDEFTRTLSYRNHHELRSSPRIKRRAGAGKSKSVLRGGNEGNEGSSHTEFAAKAPSFRKPKEAFLRGVQGGGAYPECKRGVGDDLAVVARWFLRLACS